MKILAVGGADVAMDWNGVAVGAGNDNNWTRTALCNNLDSVKNFAYMRIKRNILIQNHLRDYFKKKTRCTSSANFSATSSCLLEVRGHRTPASAMFANW